MLRAFAPLRQVSPVLLINPCAPGLMWRSGYAVTRDDDSGVASREGGGNETRKSSRKERPGERERGKKTGPINIVCVGAVLR